MHLLKYCNIVFILASIAHAPLSLASNVPPEDIVVCSYSSGDATPIKEKASNCRSTDISGIDPQNNNIWVFATLTITQELLSQTQPLGLHVYAKASSEAYLNGQYLGRNGIPGIDKKSEVPGIMDSVMYVPVEKLKLGRNELALRMSSHHGLLSLRSPIHYIGLTNYVDPTNNNLRYYWPSLLLFGALLIGAFYMGMLAWVKRNHWSVALLPLMSLVGAVQLYAEVYRGLVAYPYPVQDLRLILILACSTVFGLCLAAHVIWSLKLKYRGATFLLASALTLAAVILSKGFDIMSALALFIPATIGLILSLYRLRSQERRARAFALSLGVFLLCLLLSPSEFLNITFFYLMAILLVILFVNEIQTYSEERKERLEEKARVFQHSQPL